MLGSAIWLVQLYLRYGGVTAEETERWRRRSVMAVMTGNRYTIGEVSLKHAIK